MSTPIRTRRRLDLQGSQATIVTRRTLYGMETEEELETIEVPKFETDPARLRVEGGLTRHMGDNNYVKINVMLEVPCLPVQSEIERAYSMASNWVSAKLAQELTIATGNSDGSIENTQEDPGPAQAEAAGVRRRIDI